MTMKAEWPKNLWDNTKVVIRGKFIPIQLSPQETKKITNKQPILTSVVRISLYPYI